VQLATKANLFAESQRAMAMPPQAPAQPISDPGRPSLFNAVTGAFRRRVVPPATQMAQPQPMRQDPQVSDYHPQEPHVSVQQTSAGDSTGLEIPAFLRRQHST
jgi:hypothetical protein